MGYETKVILKAVITILEQAKDLEQAIALVRDIANAEEVVPVKHDDK